MTQKHAKKVLEMVQNGLNKLSPTIMLLPLEDAMVGAARALSMELNNLKLSM